MRGGIILRNSDLKWFVIGTAGVMGFCNMILLFSEFTFFGGVGILFNGLYHLIGLLGAALIIYMVLREIDNEEIYSNYILSLITVFEGIITLCLLIKYILCTKGTEGLKVHIIVFSIILIILEIFLAVIFVKYGLDKITCVPPLIVSVIVYIYKGCINSAIDSQTLTYAYKTVTKSIFSVWTLIYLLFIIALVICLVLYHDLNFLSNLINDPQNIFSKNTIFGTVTNMIAEAEKNKDVKTNPQASSDNSSVGSIIGICTECGNRLFAGETACSRCGHQIVITDNNAVDQQNINSSLSNVAQVQQSDISQMNPQPVQQINDNTIDNQQQSISKTENIINNPENGNKKKSKVGPVLAIIAGLIVVIAGVFVLVNTVLINVKQVKKSIEVGSVLDLTDVFECKDGVSISIKDASSIDTSSVGNYTITLLIDNGKKVSEKQFDIEVIDTTPPEISASEINVFVGSEFVPEEYIAVSDNSNLDVTLDANVSDVDTNTEGSYVMSVKASDPSGNTTTESINVNVTKIDDIQDVTDYIDRKLEEYGYGFGYEVGTNTGQDCLWINGNNIVYEDFGNSDRTISIYPFFRCYKSILGEYFEVREIQIKCEISDRASKKANRLVYTPISLVISSSSGSISGEVIPADIDSGTAVWKTTFRASIDEDKIGDLKEVLDGENVKIEVSLEDMKDKKSNKTFELSDESVQSFRDLVQFYDVASQIEPGH